MSNLTISEVRSMFTNHICKKVNCNVCKNYIADNHTCLIKLLEKLTNIALEHKYSGTPRKFTL